MPANEPPAHPRVLGWVSTTALALGGSNQSLFIVGLLIVGQGTLAGHGTAAVPLLILGLLLAWAAAPGWTELVLLSPNRVGGIAAACSDAFRPYSLVLSALTGSCYWWGWVPTCGITALIAATAIHQWALPWLPVNALAIAIICVFASVALGGMRLTARVAVPLGVISAGLAFDSALGPIIRGRVDWHHATNFRLISPFGGAFGAMTSVLAGLYLVGFAAPAFEAATCHVGEMRNPARDVPRTVFASAATAGLYFIVLPVIWLGVVGPAALSGELARTLGPVFAPLFGASAKALAVGLITFNMFHGTLQPLVGASRTLAQLADDGIFPRFLGRRSAGDVPWIATLLTATGAVAFLLSGAPLWLLAAANFAYLLSIALPSVAVWLLRRDAPQLERPYRAPRGAIGLGLAAAAVWTASVIFGFEQFGLPATLVALLLAYSGGALYAWRYLEDRHREGGGGLTTSIHLALTAAMVAVLLFDAAGYLIAIHLLPPSDAATVTVLRDIFVIVGILTIGAGVVLPGMIAEGATRELGATNARLRRGARTLQLEIAERKLAEERLLHAASHDKLTGLANRALFMDSFDEMMVGRDADESAAILFLDLDRFKLVNDSLGHDAGDLLIVKVARCLDGCMREGDTLARIGGDEFAILLKDAGGEEGATAFAERLLLALRSPFTVAGREVFASASIGIALTHGADDLGEHVLRDADIAMYRAKELGKQRYALFAPELLTRAAALLELEVDLKRALERDEFVLLYQPIVVLNTGRLRGFEALIRWHHPERGLVSPDDFIPHAEECGLILPIGAWVIAQACRQAGLWRDAFPQREPLAIGVNVSAKQFSSTDVLGQIKAGLQKFSLAPACLNIEITESAIMQSPDLAMVALTELRALGVEVNLDDFGTGYSSLGYLHRFPVDTLKIDRSFISMSGPGVGNPQIVQTITSLARSLSMKTTAEGVETQLQLDELRLFECTNAQGYFFARPLTADAATALIAGWRELPVAG
jgi:diguanylate cyclase (GGDEF)-like protein